MALRTGIDLIHIPSFEKKLEKAGFIERLFHPNERKNSDIAHLAGIAAAKEAFFKAIDHPVKWLDIEITHSKSKRPILHISDHYAREIADLDLSISHDGEYAVAQVIVNFGEKQ